jgi:hypothetical protein
LDRSRKTRQFTLLFHTVAVKVSFPPRAWVSDGRRLAFDQSRGGAQRVWVSDSDGLEATGCAAYQSTPLLITVWPCGLADDRRTKISDSSLRTGRDGFLVRGGTAGYIFDPLFSPRRTAWRSTGTERKTPGLRLLSWPSRDERFLRVCRLSAGGRRLDLRTIGLRPDDLPSLCDNRCVEPVTVLPTGSLQADSVCSVTRDGAAIICGISDSKAGAWMIEN